MRRRHPARNVRVTGRRRERSHGFTEDQQDMKDKATALRSDIKLAHADSFYIDGKWVKPSTGALIEVFDAATEEPFLRVAAAAKQDMSDAIDAARRAFDSGPWPRMKLAERARYLRALAAGIRARQDIVTEIWSRESGVVLSTSRYGMDMLPLQYERYADLAETFPFDERAEITQGKGTEAWIVREPVGVVGAIIP
ncbi:hypothetical protein N825_29120 [Skermanella stibiiresistens SB22]|uniref:Aldehyde dehydrogenase domain-containing protein n=1 Tax=Skermanella stibiiresistens SB22 TaxID=1385369 RepID=W9GUD3_9PROT|nr:hypothetical protein N825_29120 [Skermanella stibiiresistens SB22]